MQWPGILVIFAVILLLMLFGKIEWPGLHVDAPMYSTAAVNVARNYGWHYGGYTDRLLWKPEGLYDHHGVLQVILYGYLLKTTTWLRYNAANTLINVLTYLFYVFLLTRIFVRNLGQPSLFWASCAALLPTLLQLGVQGRPEHLVVPIIALPYLVYVLTRSAKATFWMAIPTAALLTLASPVVAVIFIGLVAILLLACLPIRKALPALALLGFGSTALTALTLQLATPFNLLRWLKNMSEASKIWVDTFPIEGILGAYKSQVFGGSFPSFMWNWTILFLIVLAVCSLIYYRRWLALLFLAGLGYGLANRTSDYGYIAFIPLAWLAFCDTSLSHRLPPLHFLTQREHVRLAAMITGIYCAWFAIYGLAAAEVARSHTDATSARALLQQQIKLPTTQGERSAVAYKFMHTPSFVVLGSPFEKGGVEYVDSDGASISSCQPGEMKAYEDQFGVKFRYYIHPLQAPFVFPDKSKQDYMPASLCVGGYRFQLVGGPFNKNTSRSPLSRLLPGRLKDFYSYALYRRAS